MYAEDMRPIALEELDIRQFIPLQESDGGQMRESLEDCAMFYGMGQMLTGDYTQMEAEGFRFAEPFEEEA